MDQHLADRRGGEGHAESCATWPADYLAFFQMFNQQQFFEAHEVLERLWLPARGGPEANYYKGLIQLAGAFVHWQKDRRQPAVALLKLARTNLAGYPEEYLGVDVRSVLAMVDAWTNYLTRPSGIESAVSTPPAQVLKPPLFHPHAVKAAGGGGA